MVYSYNHTQWHAMFAAAPAVPVKAKTPWQHEQHLLRDCFLEFSGKYYQSKTNAWSFWRLWQLLSKTSMSQMQSCLQKSTKCFLLVRITKRWSFPWKFLHGYGAHSIYRICNVLAYEKTWAKFAINVLVCPRSEWLQDTSSKTHLLGYVIIATESWWMRPSNFLTQRRSSK